MGGERVPIVSGDARLAAAERVAAENKILLDVDPAGPLTVGEFRERVARIVPKEESSESEELPGDTLMLSVKRAKNKRATTWVVECPVHGYLAQRGKIWTKDRAQRVAQAHGVGAHGGMRVFIRVPD